MRYLIAQRFNEGCCLAVEIENDKTLPYLMDYLRLRTMGKGIIFSTTSNLETNGESGPYELVGSEKDFICMVLEME